MDQIIDIKCYMSVIKCKIHAVTLSIKGLLKICRYFTKNLLKNPFGQKN